MTTPQKNITYLKMQMDGARSAYWSSVASRAKATGEMVSKYSAQTARLQKIYQKAVTKWQTASGI